MTKKEIRKELAKVVGRNPDYCDRREGGYSFKWYFGPLIAKHLGFKRINSSNVRNVIKTEKIKRNSIKRIYGELFKNERISYNLFGINLLPTWNNRVSLRILVPHYFLEEGN